MFVWSRNTVRESSHISLFCGGWRTHMRELTGLLEWPADLFLLSKITDLILSFQVPCKNMNILFVSCIFCLWLLIWTYILLFFFPPVICWSNQWTEISVIPSTGNKLHFSLSCETTLLMLFCDRMESAKFICGTLLPDKLVYYNIFQCQKQFK